MAAEIRKRGHVDTGTGNAEPQRVNTVTAPGRDAEPTGQATPTRQKTLTDTTHQEGPTGAAQSTRPRTMHADWPPPPDTPPDLDSKTKAELYDLATQADIDGRSTMNKDELLAALKDNR